MFVSVVLSRRSVSSWVVALVGGVLSLSWTEPAAAQKAQFDRKKPHVNVSGDAVESPEWLMSTEATSASRTPDGVDIVVFDIVDSLARDASLDGRLALAVRDASARFHDAWLETPSGASCGFVVLDEPLDQTADAETLTAWLVVLDDDQADASTIATHGYIRIKKLSSGG